MPEVHTYQVENKQTGERRWVEKTVLSTYQKQWCEIDTDISDKLTQPPVKHGTASRRRTQTYLAKRMGQCWASYRIDIYAIKETSWRVRLATGLGVATLASGVAMAGIGAMSLLLGASHLTIGFAEDVAASTAISAGIGVIVVGCGIIFVGTKMLEGRRGDAPICSYENDEPYEESPRNIEGVTASRNDRRTSDDPVSTTPLRGADSNGEAHVVGRRRVRR